MAEKQRKMQEVVDEIKFLAKMRLKINQHKINDLLIEAIVNLSNANTQLLQRVEYLENYGGGPGKIGGN